MSGTSSAGAASSGSEPVSSGVVSGGAPVVSGGGTAIVSGGSAAPVASSAVAYVVTQPFGGHDVGDVIVDGAMIQALTSTGQITQNCVRIQKPVTSGSAV